VWGYRCEVILTEGLQRYVQWLIQAADSADCGFIDCSITSAKLTGGFESFRSTGTQFIRPVGVNAVFALNSAGGWLIEEPHLTVQSGSQLSALSLDAATPIIGINDNMGDGSLLDLGGVIARPHIVQEGFINDNADVLIPINININNTNITVTGTYPDAVNPKGYIEFPTVAKNVAMGVNSSGANTAVNGIRVKGTNSNGAWGNMRFYGNAAGNATVQNCVADAIIDATTTSNNQSNATWESSHP
jgi:hypothetical protein